MEFIVVAAGSSSPADKGTHSALGHSTPRTLSARYLRSLSFRSVDKYEQIRSFFRQTTLLLLIVNGAVLLSFSSSRRSAPATALPAVPAVQWTSGKHHTCRPDRLTKTLISASPAAVPAENKYYLITNAEQSREKSRTSRSCVRLPDCKMHN